MNGINKIGSYAIIYQSSADALADEINKFIRHGWFPLGGVSTMTGDGIHFECMQAIGHTSDEAEFPRVQE